jgi:carbamoyl-phosphate synthase small subunit
MAIRLKVNGRDYLIEVGPDSPLLWASSNAAFMCSSTVPRVIRDRVSSSIAHERARQEISTMKLILADGTVFHGQSFGAPTAVRGEVVFNTGMVGYVEALTDPSYRGQLLVLTYPLQGNYGVPDGPFESARIQVHGLIVHHHSDRPSHHASTRTLSSWLRDQGVPAIGGVDTRGLTRHLRTHGTIEGQFLLDDGERNGRVVHPAAVDMSRVLDLAPSPRVTSYGDGRQPVLLIDTGTKENIVRCLLERGATIIRVPWNCPWDAYLDQVYGLVLTNGPGDPRLSAPIQFERIAKAMRMGMPILGICLGHQWLAQVAGATIFKMQYGHRSHNQPVMDLSNGRAYLTSQNHGYSIDVSTLAADWEPWFTNLNDGSNEGIRHRRRPFRSVQFHPEAAAGPRDTRFVFEEFLANVDEWQSEPAAA